MNVYRRSGKILPLLKSAKISKFVYLLLPEHSGVPNCVHGVSNHICGYTEFLLEEDLDLESSRTRISP